MTDVENVIIVGSGPAGYTAALYTARANLRPLVIEGFFWGGLLQQTTDVENYPGFPAGGIMGPELMQKFRDQAEDFGARFITDQATKVELANEPGGIGGVDGGMIGAFVAFDVPFNYAATAVVAYRAFAFWLPTLPGAVAYFQLRRTVAGWRAERRSGEATVAAQA